MRAVSLGIAILFLVIPRLSLFAASASDLGVPAGWSALQYDNYGNDLLNKHQYAQSRKYFDAAIRIEPDRWTAYYNRATAFQMEKNWTAALQDLNSTIRLQPAFFIASFIRANVQLKLGNYAASLRDLDALAKATFKVQNPGELGLVLNQRAWVRATCPDASIRNGRLALTDAKKACELDKWKRSSSIDTLAAAYAEAGDFDSAIRYEQQAISVNQSGSDEDLQSKSAKLANELAKTNPQRLLDCSHRLELYKQHRPFRDSPTR